MAVAREDTRSFAGEGMPFSMAYMVMQDNQSADFHFLGASLSQGDGATSRRVRLHRHAHYEVVFVLEGEFVQHLENGEFRYRAGDVVFLNRNVRHSEGYESDCVLVFVNLSPQLVEDLFFSTAHQLRPGAPQCSRGPIFQFLQENSRETGTDFRREYLDFFAMGGQGQAAAVLDAMAQELTMASTGYGFRIQGLLLELFAVLEDPGRYSLERIRVDARSEEFLYTRVARYLEAHHGPGHPGGAGAGVPLQWGLPQPGGEEILRADHLPAGAAAVSGRGKAPAAGDGLGHFGDYQPAGLCEPHLFLPGLPGGHRHDP